MDKLLYLCHRIPYPPNKGDKVRSFQILKELSRRFDVHLGAFVDDPADWQHAQVLEQWCAEVHLEPLSPRWATLRSATGLLTGKPLTLPYYASPSMRRWVEHTVREAGIERCMVFSSSMAQYLDGVSGELRRTIIDFVDADSAKWSAYGARKPWPLRAVYRREGARLAAYEHHVAAAVDASLFVSAEEAELLLGEVPDLRPRVWAMPNGVDTEYFDPGLDLPSPYPEGGRVVVFTGAMDYWPNVDAVTWFAAEVLPALRRRLEDVRFAVVGARPVRQVQELGRLEGVRVTGTVPDVRPYLRHAAAAVAPLRVARGIQNKVLEAMAMGRPVVMTPEAAAGLRPAPLLQRLTVEGAAGMAGLIGEILADPATSRHLGEEGRDLVTSHYDWHHNLAPLHDLLALPEVVPGDAPAPLGRLETA